MNSSSSFLTTTMAKISAKILGNTIDKDVLRYYLVGIGIGILVLLLLAIFPGTVSEDNKEDSDELIETKAEMDGGGSGTKTSGEKDAGGLLANNKQTLPQHPLQKQLEETEETESTNDSGWTPHQKLNTIVYLAMIIMSILILNHEYNGAFSVWIYHYLFPREATFLHELFGYRQGGGSTATPSFSTARDDL